jgi:hypothetical protein
MLKCRPKAEVKMGQLQLPGPGRCFIALDSFNMRTRALLGHTGLLAVDSAGNRLDVYRITHGTRLTPVSATPSQLPAPAGEPVSLCLWQSANSPAYLAHPLDRSAHPAYNKSDEKN